MAARSINNPSDILSYLEGKILVDESTRERFSFINNSLVIIPPSLIPTNVSSVKPVKPRKPKTSAEEISNDCARLNILTSLRKLSPLSADEEREYKLLYQRCATRKSRQRSGNKNTIVTQEPITNVVPIFTSSDNNIQVSRTQSPIQSVSDRLTSIHISDQVPSPQNTLPHSSPLPNLSLINVLDNQQQTMNNSNMQLSTLPQAVLPPYSPQSPQVNSIPRSASPQRLAPLDNSSTFESVASPRKSVADTQSMTQGPFVHTNPSLSFKQVPPGSSLIPTQTQEITPMVSLTSTSTSTSTSTTAIPPAAPKPADSVNMFPLSSQNTLIPSQTMPNLNVFQPLTTSTITAPQNIYNITPWNSVSTNSYIPMNNSNVAGSTLNNPTNLASYSSAPQTFVGQSMNVITNTGVNAPYRDDPDLQRYLELRKKLGISKKTFLNAITPDQIAYHELYTKLQKKYKDRLP
jgi:hypothetical protein